MVEFKKFLPVTPVILTDEQRSLTDAQIPKRKSDRDRTLCDF